MKIYLKLATPPDGLTVNQCRRIRTHSFRPPTGAIISLNVCGLVLGWSACLAQQVEEESQEEEEGANYNKIYLIQMTFSAFGLNIHPKRGALLLT